MAAMQVLQLHCEFIILLLTGDYNIVDMLPVWKVDVSNRTFIWHFLQLQTNGTGGLIYIAEPAGVTSLAGC